LIEAPAPGVLALSLKERGDESLPNVPIQIEPIRLYATHWQIF
jgi:hypothetical protein